MADPEILGQAAQCPFHVRPHGGAAAAGFVPAVVQ
jgi:hypothetical protein